VILERDTGPGMEPGLGAAEAGSTGPDLTGFGGRLGERLRDANDLERAVGEVAGVGDDPGLGLLLDLAKRGEYDPWNVDIVSVTDSYLEALDENLDAQDLRRVARLIFYAAALIHLKAKALAERQKHLDYEEALEQAFAEEFGDAFEDGPVSRLRPGDQPLDYGFLADGGPASFGPAERPVRERGLSLVDLIVALREYDDRLAEAELAEEEEDPLFTGDMAYDECVGGSHQEDLGTDIVEVRQVLWDKLADRDSVTLEELSEGRNRASSYLALLFLAQDEEVVLEQEVFYKDLAVAKGPHFGEIRAGVWDEDEDEAFFYADEDEDEAEAEADAADADEAAEAADKDDADEPTLDADVAEAEEVVDEAVDEAADEDEEEFAEEADRVAVEAALEDGGDA
jgi:segregation and condensation protein A